ncbi:MAG: hypothetical protein HOP19_15930 [Acidobacteria bacterium]|nr:hypothetical protein [Acidobacteriota bacterium]
MRPICSIFGFCLFLLFTTSLSAQTLKRDYLEYLKTAAAQAWEANPKIIEDWKRTTKPSELWGYDAPANPVYLADTLGYLYQETKDRRYAEQARDLLASYGDLRSIIPKDFVSKRVEYAQGVPAISNFFITPPYIRAYLRIRDSGVIDAAARKKIEDDLAFSLDHIFYFPEWGAHNRAMLRAESLAYGAKALANHPNAQRWQQLADTLASDSMKQWEIEDATGYHGVWLYAVFSYADISGREDVLRSAVVHYYLDYFVQLLSPHGNIPDFGDAHWNGGWERFVPVYEKAATMYRNPHYKYLAQQLVLRAAERANQTQNLSSLQQINFGVGVGSSFTDAHRWADDAVTPQAPTNLSGDVLDDVIGKKFVFRNGWQRDATMMLLNYRDEGDGGLLGRDYLRQTLSVEEEKMHHGHADENSIALLMSGGSVLLHDGGYRPELPSGQYGAWRADYFHNRVVARKNKRDKTQSVYEFIRNSGAYRPVKTQKIDFLKFKDVDASRSRVIDDELGYEWDRVVTHIKDRDYFIVVDGIKVKRDDYFTFTNLWHTRQVNGQSANQFVTRYDKIYVDELPQAKALTITFPVNPAGMQIGTFPISRHYQDETAIYQTNSQLYHAGDFQTFVTVLFPHASSGDIAYPQVKLLTTDKAGRAIGLEITDGQRKSYLCIKLDLMMDLAREPVGPRYQYELGKVKYGEFETDASYLFATRNGNQLRYGAATMTKIMFGQQLLMEARSSTFGLQLDGTGSRAGFSKWRFWEEEITVR